MLSAAFEPKGKSFQISAGIGSAVTPVNLSDIGLTSLPQALQFQNLGTADIWVVLSNVGNPTATFPVTGGGTGTPQAGFRVRPGAILIYSLNANDPTQKVPTNANAAIVGPGFYIATNTTVAAQILEVTPGEGV